MNVPLVSGAPNIFYTIQGVLNRYMLNNYFVGAFLKKHKPKLSREEPPETEIATEKIKVNQLISIKLYLVSV